MDWTWKGTAWVFGDDIPNDGVPLLTPVEGVTAAIATGDQLEVDFLSGRIRNVTKGRQVLGEALPEVVRDIIEAGGGIGHMRKRLGLAG